MVAIGSIAIVRQRAELLGAILRELGLEVVKKIEEHDPQFRAVTRVCRCVGGLAPLLSSLNALVSYMLNCRGEEYWHEYAQWACEHAEVLRGEELPAPLLVDFLRSSRCNRRLLNAKIRRLKQLASCNELAKYLDYRAFTKNPVRFAADMAKCLRSRVYSKTVLFSVKMYYYGVRACRYADPVLPASLPIPVDSRVFRVAVASGIVRLRGEIDFGAYGVRVAVQRAWNIVASMSSIPPLHLDAVIWLVGGGCSAVGDALNLLMQAAPEKESVHKRLIEELCRYGAEQSYSSR